MTDTIEILKAVLAKAQAKADRLRIQYEAANQEVVETTTAIRVLERLSGSPSALTTSAGDVGAAILAHTKEGPENGRAPKDIFEALCAEGRDDLNPDQIRTQLWRMAKRGILQSEGGRYWRVPAGTLSYVVTKSEYENEWDNAGKTILLKTASEIDDDPDAPF